MKSQKENPQQDKPQLGNAVYSLVARNRTPIVNPGKQLEIEVFISGHGMPEEGNKLFVSWSSPYVIDVEGPGILTACISYATHKVTGKTQPVAGKEYTQTWELTSVGIVGNLNKGYFSEVPDRETREFGIGDVMGEHTWGDEPPLLLTLNMAKDAAPGDYEVAFIFTYSGEHGLLQDCKAVKFHITSWWERNQRWVLPLAIVAVGIAFASLVLTAVSTIW
jgi:hypothetical protein